MHYHPIKYEINWFGGSEMFISQFSALFLEINTEINWQLLVWCSATLQVWDLSNVTQPFILLGSIRLQSKPWGFYTSLALLNRDICYIILQTCGRKSRTGHCRSWSYLTITQLSFKSINLKRLSFKHTNKLVACDHMSSSSQLNN